MLPLLSLLGVPDDRGVHPHIPDGHRCAGIVPCASLAVLPTSPSGPTHQVPGVTCLEEREMLHETESVSNKDGPREQEAPRGRAETAGARQRAARTRQDDTEWAMTGTAAMVGRETAA